MDFDTPLDAVQELERTLGLPVNFYTNLKNEDDWSFIVKLHSLFEATVSELVVSALGKGELSEIVSYLELSNKRTGKMAFVKALDLMEEDFRRYISSLSELRNEFAHNVSNVSLSLKEYVQRPNKLSSMTKNFCLEYNTPDAFGRDKAFNEKRMWDDPKECIWCSGILILACLHVRSLSSNIRHDLTSREAEIGRQLAKLGFPRLLSTLGSAALSPDEKL